MKSILMLVIIPIIFIVAIGYLTGSREFGLGSNHDEWKNQSSRSPLFKAGVPYYYFY